MKTLKNLIALLAIAALTNDVSAGDSISIGSKGFRLQMVPTDPDATSSGRVAEAKCEVRIQQKKGEVVLHWATSSFSHSSYPELTSDAVLAASVTRRTGKVAVSPSRIVDHTSVSEGDNTAAIAMGIRGNGKLRIRLEVGIDNERAAAGKHHAMVVLTVTGQ